LVIALLFSVPRAEPPVRCQAGPDPDREQAQFPRNHRWRWIRTNPRRPQGRTPSSATIGLWDALWVGQSFGD